jgi:hypothetical protein
MGGNCEQGREATHEPQRGPKSWLKQALALEPGGSWAADHLANLSLFEADLGGWEHDAGHGSSKSKQQGEVCVGNKARPWQPWGLHTDGASSTTGRLQASCVQLNAPNLRPPSVRMRAWAHLMSRRSLAVLPVTLRS